MCGLTPNHINYFNIGVSFKISVMIFSRAKLEIFWEIFVDLLFHYDDFNSVIPGMTFSSYAEYRSFILGDDYEKKEIESKDVEENVQEEC